ncbi:hypothetical protein V6N13_122263 [Hibiscus sabdariffa]
MTTAKKPYEKKFNVQCHGLYVHPANETKLAVDTSRRKTLRINFDVTFPIVACSILSLDAIDISGEQYLDVKHDIVKKRVDAHGNVIETRPDRIEVDEQCYNYCEDICDAYKNKGWAFSNSYMIDQCKRDSFLQKIKDEEGEGCNIHGSLEVNKVAGIFHFALGKSFEESRIHSLDGVHWMQKRPIGLYQYFIKAVPTIIYLFELSGTHCYFAMKVMDKASRANRKKLSMAQTEKEILQLLDDLFLPTLYAHFETDRFSCLAMEYSPGGDLHTLRQRQPGKYFFEYAASFYEEESHIMLSDFDIFLRCAISLTPIKISTIDFDPSKRGAGGAYCVKERSDIALMLMELQRTLKLEDELAEKFGDVHSIEFGNEIWRFGV